MGAYVIRAADPHATRARRFKHFDHEVEIDPLSSNAILNGLQVFKIRKVVSRSEPSRVLT
jgi:hypothetical protein